MQQITQEQLPSAVASLIQKIDYLTEKIERLTSEKKSDNLISIKELSERLGVSVRHIRRLIDERAIPYKRLGNRILFDFEEVKATFAIKVKK